MLCGSPTVMRMFVGIDFGTTNSAVGIAQPSGEVHLLPLPSGATTQSTWRSVLYFESGGKLTHGQTLNLNSITSPSFTTYSLPSMR